MNEKPLEIIRRRAYYFGKVQGIGFRYFARDAALARELRGWVRNCPDGSVELEAEGPAPVVESFLKHLETGNRWARVERMQALPIALRRDEEESFDIRS